MSRYEKSLRVLVQTAAAGLGLWIMFTALSSHDDRPWLYFAALIMMGLPGARAFGSIISGLGRVMDALREADLKPPSQKSRNGDPE